MSGAHGQVQKRSPRSAEPSVRAVLVCIWWETKQLILAALLIQLGASFVYLTWKCLTIALNVACAHAS